MVSKEDLETAIEWLNVNEGDNGESEACKRVAHFLAAEVRTRRRHAIMRQAVHEGATIDQARLIADKVLPI